VAVVEATINQPRTGPLAGSLTTPIEYTTYLVFKRDDTLTKAVAGNWILYGNQRAYDNSLRARYVKAVQNNPLKQANSAGNFPSTYESQINFSFQTSKFDPATRNYVSANVRAVRVKGPGLPTAGLVLTPNAIAGAESYMTVHNRTGVVGTTTMATNLLASNSFRLSAVASDGSALYAGYWPASGSGTPGVSNAQTYASVQRLPHGDLFEQQPRQHDARCDRNHPHPVACCGAWGAAHSAIQRPESVTGARDRAGGRWLQLQFGMDQ
jgi:hypothetical protein